MTTLSTSAAGPITASQVVDRIKAHVNCEWSEPTVDTFKAGDPNTPVTGVAVTFMDTQAVLEQAVEAGCNFIISHEPTFYSHFDDKEGLTNDAVLTTKLEFIAKHKLVVWRFHDHAHKNNPDLLNEGMIDALGLRKYLASNSPTLFVVPETTVAKMARRLNTRLGGNAMLIVGDPNLKVTQIAFSLGAPESLSQMKLLERPDVELLLAGETRQWETVPYVQDAAAQGKHKAMILLGHENSEEAGMEYVTKWLQGFVSEAPVKFISAGDPFAASQ
jgi:putative NIF3 family GTP cyclohydrolase 1 type 2